MDHSFFPEVQSKTSLNETLLPLETTCFISGKTNLLEKRSEAQRNNILFCPIDLAALSV
jgi:hypothetical protein